MTDEGEYGKSLEDNQIGDRMLGVRFIGVHHHASHTNLAVHD